MFKKVSNEIQYLLETSNIAIGTKKVPTSDIHTRAYLFNKVSNQI